MKVRESKIPPRSCINFKNDLDSPLTFRFGKCSGVALGRYMVAPQEHHISNEDSPPSKRISLWKGEKGAFLASFEGQSLLPVPPRPFVESRSRHTTDANSPLAPKRGEHGRGLRRAFPALPPQTPRTTKIGRASCRERG